MAIGNFDWSILYGGNPADEEERQKRMLDYQMDRQAYYGSQEFADKQEKIKKANQHIENKVLQGVGYKPSFRDAFINAFIDQNHYKKNIKTAINNAQIARKRLIDSGYDPDTADMILYENGFNEDLIKKSGIGDKLSASLADILHMFMHPGSKNINPNTKALEELDELSLLLEDIFAKKYGKKFE